MKTNAPSPSSCSYIVKEKELRQKELMKMMSVTESDINWSWFATFIMVHFFTATFSAVISTSLYETSDFSVLFVFWLITVTALITFSMALAALSAKTVRAVLIVLLFFFAGYVLSDIFWYEDRSIGLVQVLSVHPVAALSYGLNQIGKLEIDGVGLTLDSIDYSENKSGYSFRNALWANAVNCVIWGVLSWYLNRVIKPDYGQALPWYFPFTRNYWFPGSSHAPVSNDTIDDKMASSGIPYEPVGEALKRQSVDGKSIEIHNLKKVFGDKTAVDGLNLSMYNGQITALLGHNGKH